MLDFVIFSAIPCLNESLNGSQLRKVSSLTKLDLLGQVRLTQKEQVDFSSLVFIDIFAAMDSKLLHPRLHDYLPPGYHVQPKRFDVQPVGHRVLQSLLEDRVLHNFCFYCVAWTALMILFRWSGRIMETM